MSQWEKSEALPVIVIVVTVYYDNMFTCKAFGLSLELNLFFILCLLLQYASRCWDCSIQDKILSGNIPF